MKKTIGILILLSLMIVYIIFSHKQSRFIAGEYRYYTIYEKYKSKEKEFDFSAQSYENDKYKLETIRYSIVRSIETIEDCRKKIILFRDLINLKNNSISDYERYIENLDELKLNIENERKYLENRKHDIIELNKFIAEMERGLLSIKMYNSDILNIYSGLNSIDSTSSGYSYLVIVVKSLAASKGLDLVNEIERKKKEEHEIKRQEYLAQLQLEKEVELQQQKNSNYFPQRIISKYDDYDNHRDIHIPTQSYQSLSNVPIYSRQNVINNTSTYSPSTNPNAEPAIIEVKGYYKSNGTYVEPHVRTPKNSIITDNLRYP